MQKFKSLIIVASGLGSRMHEYTLDNELPKLLVSLGQETLLEAQLKHANEIADKTYIVCNSKHADMIDAIVKLKTNVNPKYIIYNKADGTANTVRTALDEVDNGDGSALVIWSDICLKNADNELTLQPLVKILQNKSTRQQTTVSIALDSNARHRFAFDSGFIIHDYGQHGEIAGAYIIYNVNEFAKVADKYNDGAYKENKDFVELLQNIRLNDKINLIGETGFDFIDIGDRVKYQEFMKTVDLKQRFFNEITFKDDVVVKRANCKKGMQIMQHEVEHYTFSESKAPGYYVDAIFEDGQITMQRLDQTVHEYLVKNGYTTENCKLMYDNFVKFMKPMHNTTFDYVNEHDMQNACIDEYVSTLFERYKTMQPFANVAENILKHNKVVDIITRLTVYFNDKHRPVSLIHGDTNTSNVMLNDDGEFKLIDPRGYFGTLVHVGDAKYDLAKFLYGLSGYSSFNTDTDFVATKTNNHIKHDIKYKVELDDITDDNYVKLLVGVIWLKLPQYISNNPLKSIVAYQIGIELCTKYLNRLGY